MAASRTHRHRLGGTGLALDAVVRQGIRCLPPGAWMRSARLIEPPRRRSPRLAARRPLNLLAFQAGGFATVLGAAYGLHWLSPVAVLAVVSLHLTCPACRFKSRLGLAALAGALAGLLAYAGGEALGRSDCTSAL